MRSRQDTVDLSTMFSFLHDLVEDLEKVTRWDVRAAVGGQTVEENDLQHLYKTALFTLYCALIENAGRHDEEKLDVELLLTMALVHDIAEIHAGDIASFQKQKGDRQIEYAAYTDIIAPLAEPVRGYFVHAFRHSMRGADFSIDSRESRFFHAVERLGYLKRGLHECRAGNVHFAPKCFDRDLPVVIEAAKEFKTLTEHVRPFISEMEQHLQEFQKKRDQYKEEYVRNGNSPEKFPF